MSSFSDYLENAVLDHVFRNTALTSPTTVYAAAYTVTPSDAGGGTEVTGGSYAREAITCSAASGGAITNSADVTFTTATANWGDVVAIGIFDALTAGNLLAWDGVTSTTINSGDTLKINAGDLDITLS